MIDAPAQPHSPPDTITLTLPDGATRTVPRGTPASEVVRSIGERLLRASLAVSLDGEVVDLGTPLRRGGAFRVLTEKDAESLAVLRHSGAHILATAVRRLRPDAQIGFGPAIEDGFYYDFGVDRPFTPDDLAQFEAEMRRVVAERFPFVREEVSREEARRRFTGDPLKLERIDDLGDDETISVYTDGPFVDLCRGPHVPDTSYLKHFKLLNTAGAYWRGDVKRPMLQRIYATAFFKKDDLDAHLHRIEEAKRRDHRVLGKQLDLFNFFPVAPGAAFWTPRGTTLYNTLVDFVQERQRDAFREIKTPLVYTKLLWEQSGHWGKYRENMFVVPDEIPGTDEDAPVLSGDADLMAIKPMNCPAHVLIFKQGITSYRDLPLRIYENGTCHRNEPHGALHGLMRVRQFTQDDAHIFCREDQIVQEVRDFCALADRVYKDLGFASYGIKLALRPDQRFGSDEDWTKAEGELRDAVVSAGMATEEFGWEELPGEGAFYAPKLEWHLTDAIGRTWQVGTIQSDRVLPDRLDAYYIGEDGAKHRPIMLHRAIFGSYERFIGILTEHYAGKFPLWLAPVQAVVATIVSDADAYANEVAAKLAAAGIRISTDLRNEKINYKVREHSLAKVPLLLVVGKREAEEGTVALRRLGSEERQAVMSVDEVIAMMTAEAIPPDLALG